jgi:hypothetical protein
VVDDFVDRTLADARAACQQFTSALARAGLRYVELPPPLLPVGVGVGLSWGDEGFVVAAIEAGGNEHLLALGSGVLRDIKRERLAVLEACNLHTRKNPQLPIFLHDAEAGWDLLLQQRLPLPLALENLDFLNVCMEAQLTMTQEARQTFSEANIGGAPYQWSGDDLSRLLLRSLA